MAATMCVCQDLPTTPCRGKRSCCSDAMLKTNLMGSTSKSTYSMRNRGVGGLGDPAGWKSKRNNLNEEVKEHVLLGAEALKEMGGGSQPHATCMETSLIKSKEM